MTEYFVHATVWSALGLVIGVMIGTGVRIRFLGYALDDRGRDRLIGSALIAIALISTVQSLVFQRHQSEITDCQTRYNITFQKTLQERARTTEQDRNNTFEMVSTVLTSKTREETRRALEKYVEVNRHISAERNKQRFPRQTGSECN